MSPSPRPLAARGFIIFAALLFALDAAKAAERPNILWITSEDNSPYLGCYGDPLAPTPHLDRLAARGVRYRNAFANAPVCSSARTTLITGMYASSLGAHHHRSRVLIPGQFKLYPEHLRAALRAEILATRDTGFIPEGMFPKLAGEQTIYDYARSDAYPLARILDLADKASDRNPAHLPAFIAALDDPDPVSRYWAATGCLILQSRAAPAKTELRARLNDEWPGVRVVAAEAIAHLGEEDAAVGTISGVLRTGNLPEALAALNALDFLWQAGLVPLEQARELVRDLQFAEPGDRIPRYLLSQP